MIDTSKKEQLMIGVAILLSLFWASIYAVAEEQHFSISLKEPQPFMISIPGDREAENLWLAVENKSA